MVNFTDSAAISGVKVTQEGYLIADAYTVRTGIQVYLGSEVGRPDLATVNVYRPEAEVFHKDSVASFSHVPVTMDHPQVAVDSSNWGKLAKGEASAEVMRDGERLRIPLIVKDAAAIQSIQAGKRQLSAGYSCDLDFADGVTPDGTPYQAIQRNIRANHIAIVQNGRAGADFRIGDSAASNWGAAPIPQVKLSDKEKAMSTRIVMVDGLPIETTDAGALAIEKLTKDRDTALAAQKSLADGTKVALEAKDTEIGTLKVEVKKLQDAQPNGAVLDALVAARTALVDTARKLVKDLNPAGLTDAAIRRAVVVAKLGEETVKDSSEAEISGMFKALSKDAGNAPDPVQNALVNGKPVNTNDADAAAEAARNQMIVDMQAGKAA